MNALILAIARRAINELDLDCGVKKVINDIETARCDDMRLQSILESDAPNFIRDVGALCAH
jgi:hypothetical protein